MKKLKRRRFMAELTLKGWDVTGLSGTGGQVQLPPEDYTLWEFAKSENRTGGKAWVFYAKGSSSLTKPVILSDGFHAGETRLDDMWNGIERGEYPFASNLRERGFDLIILGYNDCTASILDNARTAQECLMRAIAERQSDVPLTVGGFSMGGLITRYVLCQMEMQRMDHQTATYISYDSPHHGAWMPIAMQALAHRLKVATPDLSAMINSDAAKQLLRFHIETLADSTDPSPLRQEFLNILNRVGEWPQRPRLLAVANGAVKADVGVMPVVALKSTGAFNGTLYTQLTGDEKLVAEFPNLTGTATKVLTSGLPAADAVAGGKLRSFGLAAEKLRAAGATVECANETTSFVPTASALAVNKPDIWGDLNADLSKLSPEDTPFTDFKISSKNTLHTSMTAELGSPGFSLEALTLTAWPDEGDDSRAALRRSPLEVCPSEGLSIRILETSIPFPEESNHEQRKQRDHAHRDRQHGRGPDSRPRGGQHRHVPRHPLRCAPG
ncbi:MAG: esterase/lipase family protein, partial [Byssovorax sp.]